MKQLKNLRRKNKNVWGKIKEEKITLKVEGWK